MFLLPDTEKPKKRSKKTLLIYQKWEYHQLVFQTLKVLSRTAFGDEKQNTYWIILSISTVSSLSFTPRGNNRNTCAIDLSLLFVSFSIYPLLELLWDIWLCRYLDTDWICGFSKCKNNLEREIIVCANLIMFFKLSYLWVCWKLYTYMVATI